MSADRERVEAMARSLAIQLERAALAVEAMQKLAAIAEQRAAGDRGTH
jgi:hypothetical protein